MKTWGIVAGALIVVYSLPVIIVLFILTLLVLIVKRLSRLVYKAPKPKSLTMRIV